VNFQLKVKTPASSCLWHRIQPMFRGFGSCQRKLKPVL
jgi:hypothetical protein